jgi:thioredoxin reductase (NADPH)
MIQGIAPGGQPMTTTDVENYPGFADVVQGPWLMEQMRKQAAYVGVTIVADQVKRVDLKRRPFRIECDCGDVYLVEALILATGARARWLELPSQRKFRGYWAKCDGFFYRDKEIPVIGGGNTAVKEALFLTNFASTVTLVHRRDSLRADKILQDRLFRNRKIQVVWDTVLHDIVGSKNPLEVADAHLRNVTTGAVSERRIDGVFIAIGRTPATELVAGQVETNSTGHIKTAPYSTATSVPGFFAAGGVADDVYRQTVTAAGLGCMAALDAERFLAEEEASSMRVHTRL